MPLGGAGAALPRSCAERAGAPRSGEREGSRVAQALERRRKEMNARSSDKESLWKALQGVVQSLKVEKAQKGKS